MADNNVASLKKICELKKLNFEAVKGMFYGLTIGDCLGMPFEFNRGKDQGVSNYSEIINKTEYNNKWHGKRSTVEGQGSDDSEMTFSLYDCLKNNNFIYDKNKVLLRYMEFANNSSFLGKNTVALFKGVTTIKGYESRAKKLFSEEISQSNGSLMRISPLIFCTSLDPDEVSQIVELDTGLSNPCSVNYTFGFIYLYMLRNIVDIDFKKENLKKIFDFSIEYAKKKYGNEILIDSLKKDLPKINGLDKGWVYYACHCAIYSIFNHNNKFSDQLKNIIIRGGDTDTTGSITGGLLGALLYKEMLLEETTNKNMEIVEKADTSKGSYPKPDYMTIKALN